MHPKLQEYLDNLAIRFEKVSAFAELLPMYADTIIENHYEGNSYHSLGNRYKDMYFAWDISWYVNKPTNFPDERTYEEGVVCIYINCMQIFGEALYHMAHEKRRVHMKDVPVYYYDISNSTYYFKPHELEGGLEALHVWYLDNKASADAYLKEKRRKELQAELEKLNA